MQQLNEFRMRGLLIVLILAICTLHLSCTSNDEPNSNMSRVSDTAHSFRQFRDIQTKSILSKLSEGITQIEVEKYIHERMNIPSQDVKEILRYDIDEDAYIFIVNLKEGGWYFFSGDITSEPVLAHGESGSFKIEEITEHELGWFSSIRNHMISNRNNKSREVENNKKEWMRPYRTQMLEQYKNELTRDETDSGDVSIDIRIDTLINVDYPALTVTHWNQINPWNRQVPMYGNSTRCVAGCTVIAIAQLLYYTHYAFGFPNYIYANASCNDYFYEGPPYDFNLTNLTTSTWDLMTAYGTGTSSYEPYMPALCAYVAQISNTEYSIDSTLLSTYYEPSQGITVASNYASTLSFFQLTGATTQIFDEATVKNEIAHNRPVLCTGSNSSSISVGHAFLVHGYSQFKYREVETFTDENGAILEQNITVYDHFYWRINPGAYNQQFINVVRNSYYPINPTMTVGWTQ